VSAWDIVLIVAFSVMGIVAIWFPLMLAAALFSGWWELAKRFPAQRPIGENAERGVGTVVFSPLFRYKGIVHYAADQDALHLSMPLLGVFHPPVTLPFAELRFFAGERTVLGMMPVEADGRRLLMSRSMLAREAAVRRELGLLHDAGEHEPVPQSAAAESDTRTHAEHAHAPEEDAR
jgi:hypothetical protein